MRNITLPGATTQRLCEEAGRQVVESVNSYVGRARISVNRMAPMDEDMAEVAIVLNDTDAPVDGELCFVWHAGVNIDLVIELIIANIGELHE